MLLFDGALGMLMLGLWIFCIIDVITTPEARCRNLPKIAWLLIVILLAAVGSIVWLIAGRPWDATQQSGYRGRPRTGTPAPPRRMASNPDDDEEFIAALRARAEEQRRRAREAQQRDPDRPDADGN
jgi:hypothetical protein